ncbi:MAG TPA: transcription-repair coupling factor [Burkholderiales bacterium]|nr:transcription-repair coupling factor [Burkholderiales bacterium]
MHRDPLPGKKRYCGLTGSSDALALARLAAESRPLAVLSSIALDAARLLEEIAWFAPQLRSCLLPDWETLPYDSFSPHHDLVSERLATLYQIQRGDFDIVIVPAATALVRLCPPAYLAAYTFFLRQGERLDGDALRRQLALAGYNAVTQVMTPGEFCFRGSIVDLFPMGSAVPYRLDLDDDLVETIRTFDVDSQRTLYATKEVRLLPAREFPLDDKGRTGFRGRWRELFEGDPSKRRLYKDISSGVPAAGVEYYLPLFFDALATIFDYLPETSTIVLHRDVSGAIQAFWRDAQSRFKMLGGDPDRPLLPPAQLFMPSEEFYTRVKAYPRIDIAESPEEDLDQPVAAASLPPLAVDRRAKDPLASLKAYIAGSGLRVLLSSESPGRRETMLSYFREYGLAPFPCEDFQTFNAKKVNLQIVVSPLANGFSVPAEGWAVITEAELYAGTARRKGRGARAQSSVEGMLRDLSELNVGDPVVHAQHGIGRYGGLVNMDLGEGVTEFLLLEYGGGDKLYVPVSQLEVISRYSGAQPEEAPLHKLGSGQWDKARNRAARQVRDTAAELLELYAKRAARQGHAFGVKQHDVDAFADGFGFEETADQAAAIQAVSSDMTSGKPMDRLICGDVGFGKTEVALRAAFVAVADSKQVALLCPTTLLVEQHFQTFSDRFADWPVKIGELSRFRTGKESAEVLKKLACGDIDIAIGTHKLLSREVKFDRLGLVIIDEEHRFGVHQKEALKQLRAEVDVLTLTATPIPRTLALSLEGLRDFSVIATAPERRLAIKTFVAAHSDGLIREAVLRELRRGGQVYYLHNEVDTIEHAHDKLARLLPEARIAVAHGQMRERELERVMREFTQQRHNVLLCSTIIETGIDNPNANTMVIHRADRFGLAQLHQLRGRVGRSHHQAYAYLLTPPKETLGAQAKKRLEAIQSMEQLGSGFYLAMHDLEIRGAGEVLGDSQSGQIQEIGFDLYTRMLERAVRALRDGKAIDLDQPIAAAAEIKLHTPALLPETYCSDVHERLTLYKRLANCATQEELDAMHEELIDRFGLPPEPARALLDSHQLRLLAGPLGIARIDATHEALQLQFQADAPVDRGRIIALVQKKKNLRFAGTDRLRQEAKMPEWPQRVLAVRDLLQQLAA